MRVLAGVMPGVMPVMPGRKPLNSALAEAAEARVEDVLPVQEDLHELLGFPAHAVTAARAESARRAGGRPAGARNKRLDEVARLVRERFGDVLLQQVAVATMPLDHLLALGLKPLEAFQEKRLAAATVLPYIEQKRPIAVDVTGRQVVHLSIEIGDAEAQQDQGVIGGLVLQLDSAQLDGAPNSLMSQQKWQPAQLIEDQAGDATLPPLSADTQPPAAPALAPAAAGTPPGGGFAPPPLSRAPAGVVPRHRAVFDPMPNTNPAQPGGGGRG